MSAPIFIDTANSIQYTLVHPQTYRAIRVPTWVDHESANGAVRRDFTKLERVMQFQLGWEALLPSEWQPISTVWTKMISGFPLAYTDVEGATWTVQADPAGLPLTWTGYQGARDGFHVTLYTAILLFRGIGAEIPWP